MDWERAVGVGRRYRAGWGCSIARRWRWRPKDTGADDGAIGDWVMIVADGWRYAAGGGSRPVERARAACDCAATACRRVEPGFDRLARSRLRSTASAPPSMPMRR